MSEFDTYSDSYRTDVEAALPAGLDQDRFTAVKAAHVLELAGRRLGPPSGLTALDVGCGTGETDRHLAGAFGELHGVDVAEAALARARAANPAVEYRAYTGDRLPHDDDRFDISFSINVMHHVPPPGWDSFARELVRVTKPGGLVAVFEHNPLNPLTRRVVSRCVFDEDAVLLRQRRTRALLAAAGAPLDERRYILFIPSAAPWARTLERPLRMVPLGAQYYVAGRVR